MSTVSGKDKPLGDISLILLDIAMNSFKAGSRFTEITVSEDSKLLKLTVKDNGCGIPAAELAGLRSALHTKSENSGRGIPLLKLAAENTGGYMEISSSVNTNHGTAVTAVFLKENDCFPPLGDIPETVKALTVCCKNGDFKFAHLKGDKSILFDTRQMRNVLDGVPLDSYRVLKWTEEYLKKEYEGF